MNRAFTLFRQTILQNLRDTAVTLGQMIIFPIVLIFILGMALKSVYGVNYIEPTWVGYLNEDSGVLASQVDEFMSRPEIGDYLEVRELSSLAEGEEALRERQITVLIHVPRGYSARGLAGDKAEISILGRPDGKFGLTLVETVMESFTYGGNAIQALASLGNHQAQFQPAVDSIEDNPLSADALRPNAMAYYAVTMLVMISMYGTLYGAFGMSENTQQPVGLRVRAAPIRAWELYGGVVLGNVATIFTGSLIIMAFTRFVYGVGWGNNLSLVLLITFLNSVLTVGLGVMAMMLIRDVNRASATLNILVVASTFLAGGYYKLSLPRALAWIQYFSPNYLTQIALFNTIYQGSQSQTVLVLFAMVGIIVVSFVVAMVGERRSRL